MHLPSVRRLPSLPPLPARPPSNAPAQALQQTQMFGMMELGMGMGMGGGFGRPVPGHLFDVRGWRCGAVRDGAAGHGGGTAASPSSLSRL